MNWTGRILWWGFVKEHTTESCFFIRMGSFRRKRKSVCTLHCRFRSGSCCCNCLHVLVLWHRCNLPFLPLALYILLIRPCGPNKKAIIGATYDLAKNDPGKEPFESLPEHAFGNLVKKKRLLTTWRCKAQSYDRRNGWCQLWVWLCCYWWNSGVF